MADRERDRGQPAPGAPVDDGAPRREVAGRQRQAVQQVPRPKRVFRLRRDEVDALIEAEKLLFERVELLSLLRRQALEGTPGKILHEQPVTDRSASLRTTNHASRNTKYALPHFDRRFT